MRASRTLTSALTVMLAAAATVAAAAAVARPNRYGHSDREERHLFPAVSSGPLDPAFSPDGRWIAFSMRGDIWKVPADGGEAIAITSARGLVPVAPGATAQYAPVYYFEPAWSPDGRRVAFTMDVGGNLDIGIVSADGGAVTRVSPHARVDLQAEWGADNNTLYFVSARAGGYRIYRHDLTTGRDSNIAGGIQPARSPDGRSLAYEQGGLRVLDLTTMQSRLLREEETEYRMNPAWTPDGQNIFYVTEDEGSNDIRVLPLAGGDPIEVTVDDVNHEMSPSISPSGDKFAFVAFRGGVPTLYTAALGGGRPSSWNEVRITSRRPVVPTGRVRLRVTGPNGQEMPARVYVDASDGRGYSPATAFHRAMMVTDRHYFHTDGDDEIELPAGATKIEVMRGFEFQPKSATIEVRAAASTAAAQAVNIQLERLVDARARGWYSGDGHVHDLHQGFGLTHEAFFLQLVAEDLNVSNPLIHMDGTRLMGRWSDLTGRPHPLSTATHILQYCQEFRGGLGHIGMIGTREFITPFIGGQGGSAYSQHSLDERYVNGAHAQGGLAGYMHPYQSAPRTPAAAASTLIALDAALGQGDYYDIGALWSDELGSAHFYYRLLNAGFRIAATGGTDNFSDVWRDPPPGSDRTYARVEGTLTMQSWMDAIRRGRTFMTTGPLLFMDVNGRFPGDSISVAATGPAAVRVKVEALSIAPMDSLQIVVNGNIVVTRAATGASRARLLFDEDVAVPEGGWVAARVLGAHSEYIGDDYVFAHTGPVYIVRGGRRYTKLEDVQFLSQTVDAIWSRVERTRWRSDAERDRFKAAVDSAKVVYSKLSCQLSAAGCQ